MDTLELIIFLQTEEDVEKAILKIVERGIETPINGPTALWWAVHYDKEQLVKALLDLGANPDAHQNDDLTPLIFAIQYNRYNTAKTLVEYNADVHIVHNTAGSALSSAVSDNHLPTVKLMVEKGVNPFKDEVFGKTSYQRAVDQNSQEIITYFESVKSQF